MRERVPDEATCAICGRHFDPSETRGWCPNPSCGEWQHPSFPIDEGGEEGDEEETEQESESSPPMRPCPNCGNEVRAAANFCKHCATQLTGDNTPQADPDSGDGDSVIEECPDCSADLTGIPSDSLSTCPICMFDLTPVLDDAEDGSVETSSEPQPGLSECPNCGEDLSAIPEDMRTVCPGCRVDLEEGLEAETEPPDSEPAAQPSGESSNQSQPSQSQPSQSQPSQSQPSQSQPSQSQPSQSQPSQSQPSQSQPQGAQPQPDQTDATGGATESGITGTTALRDVDEIAEGYVQRLTDSGLSTVGDLVSADPDTVSAQTGISARRIRGWIDELPVDSQASGPSTSTQSGQQQPTGGRQSQGGQRGQNQPQTGGQNQPQTGGQNQPQTGGQNQPQTGGQNQPQTGGQNQPQAGGQNQPQAGGQNQGASGTGDDSFDQETKIQRSSDDLVLEVEGQELSVSDGATVGREVREAMVDAGAPEEDAVYVHRKHVRVDKDESGYYLTRLGENSLTVNGQTVEKGNEARIGDGDEIGFSDVVTATVSIR